VFYERTGAFPGSYEHPVRERMTRVRMLARSDGTVLLQPTRPGVRLWSAVEGPGMDREYQLDETRRHNPWLAEFMNPHRGRHGGAGALAISGIVSSPTRSALRLGRAALFGTGGAFGVIYAGQLAIPKLLPVDWQVSTDPLTGAVVWKNLAAHTGVRLGIGVAADWVLHRMLSTQDFLALNVGMGIGILGAFALEALGATLTLGKGEAAVMPTGSAASVTAAADAGAYVRRVAGAGAYIATPGHALAARLVRPRALRGDMDMGVGGVGDYWPTMVNSITRSSFDRT
jgi:hypothetical protein